MPWKSLLQPLEVFLSDFPFILFYFDYFQSSFPLKLSRDDYDDIINRDRKF